jgi:hypothetical protein
LSLTATRSFAACLAALELGSPLVARGMSGSAVWSRRKARSARSSRRCDGFLPPLLPGYWNSPVRHEALWNRASRGSFPAVRLKFASNALERCHVECQVCFQASSPHSPPEAPDRGSSSRWCDHGDSRRAHRALHARNDRATLQLCGELKDVDQFHHESTIWAMIDDYRRSEVQHR